MKDPTIEEKILRFFKKQPDIYISGEDISDDLKISRAALWKHIEKLRSQGYEFEAVPNLGYRLKDVPDKLYPQEIESGLKTQLFGKEIVYYDTIDSTNKVAYELAKDKTQEGLVVIAEAQTKGRGRLSREWVSPKEKGIYMSVVIKPEMTPFQAPKITLVTAVSAALAIRDYAGATAFIKWPNDILINSKKVGGILTEMDAEQDSVNFLVVGIGINVNTKISELPRGASSLMEETGNKISRAELVKRLLEKLEHNYTLFKKEGFEPIVKQFCDLSATLGRRVRATCMHRKIEGEAIGIDSDGALVIRLDTGFQEKVLAGDVILLR